MRKEIKHAYDNIHVSDEMTERLKQELYQKDFHEDEISETFEVQEAPRWQFGKYFGFIAASIVFGVGIGISMWGMLESRSEQVLNPKSTVPVEITAPAPDTPEETEETTEETPLLKEYYHQ